MCDSTNFLDILFEYTLALGYSLQIILDQVPIYMLTNIKRKCRISIQKVGVLDASPIHGFASK